MSVETQEPLTNQSPFNNHGNSGIDQSQTPSQNFTHQSDYFLHHSGRNATSYNFYGSYSLSNNGSSEFYDKDANENTNPLKVKPLDIPLNATKNNTHNSSPSVDIDNNKTDNTEHDIPEIVTEPFRSLKPHVTSSPIKEEEKPTDTSSHNPECDKSNHSPLSTTSLSDSEVPDNEQNNSSDDKKQLKSDHHNNNPSIINKPEDKNDCKIERSTNILDKCNSPENYYKNYLQKYADNFRENNDEKVNNGDQSCIDASPDSCKENCEPFNLTPKKHDQAEVAKLEEAVKHNLDEAIRVHHSRITTLPVPANDRGEISPVTPGSNSSSSQHQLSPYSATHQLSPHLYANNSLSPRSIVPPSSHVRQQLNFNNKSPLSPPAVVRNLHPPNFPGGQHFPGIPPAFLGRDPRLNIPPPFHHFPPTPSDLLHRHSPRGSAITALPPQPLTASGGSAGGGPTGNPRTEPATAAEAPNSFHQYTSPSPHHQKKRGADGKEFYYCHLCSYVGSSEFHFNAHMNTHFEHQCPHCDYKSRTEGRLKRHIKDFHTEDNPTDFTGGRIVRKDPAKQNKIFRCRQCEFVCQDKEEYWKHTRSHIKDDKCLQCPKCSFVTEYKHHLEYHLRNHFGSKPFKCNKCNYSCVNKSMLNSHMKSHTNVYQYRCQDCTYATKYCHSLKLHLSKYNHQPATVLNNDGSLPVDGVGDFDMVSKRGPPRGPRLIKYNPDGLGPPPSLDVINPNLPPGMHPNMGMGNPLNGMAAMMGAFWSGGMAPPPLIPVSGLGPLNIQMPGHPQQEERKQLLQKDPSHSSQHHPASPSGHPPHHGPSHHHRRPRSTSPPEFKPTHCRFCDFFTDSQHVMASHMMRHHGNEHGEIFKMFGFPRPPMSHHADMMAAEAARSVGSMRSREEESLVMMRRQHEQNEMRRRERRLSLSPTPRGDSAARHYPPQLYSPEYDHIKGHKYDHHNDHSRSSDSRDKYSPTSSIDDHGRVDGYLMYDRSRSVSPNDPVLSPPRGSSPALQYKKNSRVQSIADAIEKECSGTSPNASSKKRDRPLDLTSSKPGNGDEEAGEDVADVAAAAAVCVIEDAGNELSPGGLKRKWGSDEHITDEAEYNVNERNHDDNDAEEPQHLQQQQQPGSNASGNSDENEHNSHHSPNSRKRSRKGKAYKLDMISIKLQEQYAADSADVATGDEFDDELGGDEDVLLSDNTEKTSVIVKQEVGSENCGKTGKDEYDNEVDYSDIQMRIRELNGDMIPCEGGDNDDTNCSPPPIVVSKSGQNHHHQQATNSLLYSSSKNKCSDKASEGLLHRNSNSAMNRRKLLNVNATSANNHHGGSSRNSYNSSHDNYQYINHDDDEEFHTEDRNSDRNSSRLLYNNSLSASKSQHQRHVSQSESTAGNNINSIDSNEQEEENSGDSSDWSKYECEHCGIAFRDCIMYTMHMGYHGFQDAFTCNRCGVATKDRVEFFLHIARKAHA